MLTIGSLEHMVGVNACRKGQNLMFASANVHNQNGYTERQIQELQELARPMLTPVNRMWPKMITTNLWP